MFVAPRAGEKPVTRGATRKLPLPRPMAPRESVTRMGPVVASTGTIATIRESEVTLKSATVVSKLTNAAVEKPEPTIRTCVPGLPTSGEKLLRTGAAKVSSAARRNGRNNAGAPAQGRVLMRIEFAARKVMSALPSVPRIEQGYCTGKASISQIR